MSSMSLKSYDDAILAYFKNIFTNTVYAPTDLAFKTSAMNNDDVIKLPLISVFRTPNLTIGENENFRAFNRGRVLRRDTDTLQMDRLRLLPISMEYQVDLWTGSIEEMAFLFPEVLFYLKEFPAFEVDIPNVDDNISHSIRINDVVDNTDLVEEQDRGRLGRMSIVIAIDGFISKPTSAKIASSVDATIDSQ